MNWMRLWKGEEMRKAVLKNNSVITLKYYIRMLDAMVRQWKRKVEKARLGG